MDEKRRALEETLNEINAALEVGSVIERRQYRFQANLENIRRETSSFETKIQNYNSSR